MPRMTGVNTLSTVLLPAGHLPATRQSWPWLPRRFSQPHRRAAAAVLQARLLEIMTANPAADILIVGDLNENVDEADRVKRLYPTALAPLFSPAPGAILVTGRPPSQAHAGQLVFFSPWLETAKPRGSYVYRGEWQTPDHFLLSAGLFDDYGFKYRPGSFRVASRGLTHPRTGYPLGSDGGGASDHLPIILTLEYVEAVD